MMKTINFMIFIIYLKDNKLNLMKSRIIFKNTFNNIKAVNVLKYFLYSCFFHLF